MERKGERVGSIRRGCIQAPVDFTILYEGRRIDKMLINFPVVLGEELEIYSINANHSHLWLVDLVFLFVHFFMATFSILNIPD